jgi:hypothetical protein
MEESAMCGKEAFVAVATALGILGVPAAGNEDRPDRGDDWGVGL